MASSDVDTWSVEDLLKYLENQIGDIDVESEEELRLLVKCHKENSNQRHENEERGLTERTLQAFQAERITIRNILAKDQVKRLDLIQLYTETQQFDHKFAESLNLKHQYPNRIEKLDGYICDLQDKTCPIVVAGEVGSGKSSFLNLLVGEEIFPSAHLPCTSAICKLENSDCRAMKVTFDDHLTESYNIPDLKTLQDLMRKYSRHNRTSEQRKCQQIDIYWPITCLPKNVVLVDVPGIGENPEMDTQVLNYTSKALVCIYIVFSCNSGGVQKEKLKLILRHRIENFVGVNNPFEHTLFLCNHWDKVSESGEEDRVWNYTLNQLKSCIEDLNEDNVMKISVKKAAHYLEIGFVQSNYVKDWEKILQRFNLLLLDSLTAKTSHHYSIMASMLNETEKYLADRRRFAVIKGDEKKELLAKISSRSDVIVTDTEKAKQEILTSTEQEFKVIAKELHAFIHSEETKKRLLNSMENSNETDDSRLYIQVTEKVECLIQEWEKNKQRIAGLKKKVEEKVRESIGQILSMIEDNELILEKKYENARRRKDYELEKIFTRVTSGLSITEYSLLAIPVLSGHPALKTFGMFLHATLCVLGPKLADKIVSSIFRKPRFYLEYILKESLTAEKLSDVIMQTYNMPMKQGIEWSFKEHVSKKMDANMKQLQTVKKEKRSEEEILLAICEAIHPFSQIVGRLKSVHLVYLSDDYISGDNIKIESNIGGGQFSDVYKATMEFPDRSTDVAIQVLKKKIQPETLINQMNELEQIRVLRHDNIVGYFGVRLQSGGRAEGSDFSIGCCGGDRGDQITDNQPSWMNVFGKKLAICLELCDESLEENAFRTFRIQDRLGINEESSLSTGGRSAALAHYQRIIQGVTSGLAYIHDKGYMHRDLKLSNVLIRDGVAKITDFGMSRACDLSHNTMAGTFTHMSPEMLERKKYSKPTDVYSMAILMWEFWYGQQSFTEQSPRMNVIELTNAIMEGLRPKMSADVRMPSQLHELVVACWQADPDQRPTATELLERLSICNINLEQM